MKRQLSLILVFVFITAIFPTFNFADETGEAERTELAAWRYGDGSTSNTVVNNTLANNKADGDNKYKANGGVYSENSYLTARKKSTDNGESNFALKGSSGLISFGTSGSNGDPASEPRLATDDYYQFELPTTLYKEIELSMTMRITGALVESAPAIPVTEVKLDKESATLRINNTLKLSATVLPGNASNPKVNWETSNEDVATVDEDGTVTAVSAGIAVIKAISDDNGDIFDACSITVTDAPEPVEVAAWRYGTGVVDSAYNSVVTASLDNNNKGNNTYVSNGGAYSENSYLTARKKSTDNGESNFALKGSVGLISFGTSGTAGDPASEPRLAQGDYYQFELPTKYYKDISMSMVMRITGGSPRDFKWQYSYNGDDFQDTDLTLSLRPGSSTFLDTINAEFPTECENQDTIYFRIVIASDTSYNGNTITTTGSWGIDSIVFKGVLVESAPEIPVTEVKLDKENATLRINNTLKLSATVLPGNASNPKVNWETSNEDVATVDEDGTVTAVSAGIAVIKAISDDNGDIFDTCTVTVNDTISYEFTELAAWKYGSSNAAVNSSISSNSAEKNSSGANVAVHANYGVLKDDTLLFLNVNGLDGTPKYPLVGSSSQISTGTTDPNLKQDGYFQFEISTKGYTNIKVNAKTRSSSTGPNDLRWQYSLTGNNDFIDFGTTFNTRQATIDAGYVDENGSPVISVVSMGDTNLPDSCYNLDKLYIRLTIERNYNFNGGNIGNTSTWGINDIIFSGIFSESALVIPVEEVRLNKSNEKVFINDTLQLTASVFPGYASNKDVYWESSDESVADVDDSGMVTAKSAGTVVIKAISEENVDIFGTCVIIVEDMVNSEIASWRYGNGIADSAYNSIIKNSLGNYNIGDNIYRASGGAYSKKSYLSARKQSTDDGEFNFALKGSVGLISFGTSNAVVDERTGIIIVPAEPSLVPGDYYQFEVPTRYFKDIVMSMTMRLTSGSPGEFKWQYSYTGENDDFHDMGIAITRRMSSTYVGTIKTELPTELCDDKESLFLRLVIASTVALNGGIATQTGSWGIDNIIFTGTETGEAPNNEGTAEDPHQIGSAEDLLFITERLNNNVSAYTGLKHYILTDDIDLSGINFPMINNFDGVLDGQGHTINGLVIEASGNQNVGFIRTNTGTVKNLAIEDASVTSINTSNERSSAAILVGRAGASGYISDCKVTGTVSITSGGQALVIAGGIVGDGVTSALTNETITDSFFSGTVIADGNGAPNIAGGICGYTYGTVNRCIAMGDIYINDTADGSSAALIVGRQESAQSISNNVAYSGTVHYAGAVSIGSIYGNTNGEPGEISGNIAAEDIMMQLNSQAPSQITNTVNVGLKTSAELQQQDTYESIGWDFEFNWKMYEDMVKSVWYPVPKYVTIGGISRVTVTVSGDTATQRGFTWYINSDEVTDLKLIVSEFENNFSGASVFTAIPRNTGDEYVCQTVATGLKPNTQYYYRIKYSYGGNDYGTKIGKFKTAPVGNAPFTFLNFSDSEVANSEDAEFAAWLMEKGLYMVPNAEFILHNGDFTADGTNEELWNQYIENAKSSFMETTLVPVAGEKEALNNSFANHFKVGGPTQDTSTGAYYSFNYGGAHFVVLNTNEGGESGISDTQLNWLRSDVMAARSDGAQWVILALHKGPHLTADHSNDSDVLSIRETLVPVIKELGIELVLQGHDHIYARTKYFGTDGSVSEDYFSEYHNGKRLDYTVDKNGTFYLSSGPAGNNLMTQKVSSNYIKQYFERSDQAKQFRVGQTFSSITVDSGRLTVNIYSSMRQNDPIIIEGFGIDREIPAVIEQINSLSDENSVKMTRDAYNRLTPEQRAQISNYDVLTAKESQSVPSDKWMVPSASKRQAIAVRNDTKYDFDDAPVLIKLENIPDTTLSFYDENNLAIPYEVESLNVNGITTVWVKLTRISAKSVAFVWVYYGGIQTPNDPTAVWNRDYQLVEHFTEAKTEGDRITDSTGKIIGTVVGAGYTVSQDTTVEATKGQSGAAFNSTKIQYDAIVTDYDQFSISAIVNLTDEELASFISPNGAIIAKELSTNNTHNTFILGLQKSPSKMLTNTSMIMNEYISNRRYNDKVMSDFTADSKPHLLSLSYDGMTRTVFIDGKIVSELFLERTTTFNDPNIPLTIGAFSDIGRIANPFKGTIYEAQVTGYRLSPEWEAFRYSNYFGDAVNVGSIENKGDASIIADIPNRNTILESSVINVYGAASKDSTLTASIDGTVIDFGNISAGAFMKEIPLDASGTTMLTLSINGAEYIIPLTLEISSSPDVPMMSETLSGDSMLLSIEHETDFPKALSAEVYVNESIPLTTENVKVYEGSTSDILPDNIIPGTSGNFASVLNPTTKVSNGTNPYQIYEIALTSEQRSEQNFRLSWRGEASGREVTAYVRTTANAWNKVGYVAGDGELTIDMNIPNNNVVKDGKLYLLFLRSLTVPIESRTGFIPDKGQFDFSILWNTDTQYITEMYPIELVEQQQYMADIYHEKKGIMSINTGDLMNRPDLQNEYQWKNINDSYIPFEKANIPYTIAWGNHDFDDITNNRILYEKYCPLDRLRANSGDWVLEDSYPAGKTDSMYYTYEKNGVKLLLLTLSYYANVSSINWAKDVIEMHPDYTVIIATHQVINGTSSFQSGTISSGILNYLIQFPNVKLSINGHHGGAGLNYKDIDGKIFYAVLSDYQFLPYGGYEFFRYIQFDVENGIVYFNTYSPMEHQTQEPYKSPLGNGTYSGIPGLYQKNKDEFALIIDIDGGKERTLKTTGLTLSVKTPEKTGETLNVIGNEPVSITASGLNSNNLYEWYVKLTDKAGNVTITAPRTFTMEDSSEDPTVPDQEIVIGQASYENGIVTIPFTTTGSIADSATLGFMAFAVTESDSVDTVWSNQNIAYQTLFSYNSANSSISFPMPLTTGGGIAGIDTTKILLIKIGNDDLGTASKLYTLPTSPADPTDPSTPPSAPITLNVTSGTQKAVLSWTNAAQGAYAAGLQISLNGTSWQSLSGSSIISGDALNGAYLNGAISTTATTVEVLGLNAGTRYFFKLTIVGGASAGTYTGEATPLPSGNEGSNNNNNSNDNKNWGSLPSGGGSNATGNVSLPPSVPVNTDHIDNPTEIKEATINDLPSFMPISAKLEIIENAPWAAESIATLVRLGAVDGTSDSFRPNANVTRAEFLKIAVIIFGLDIDYKATPDFDDTDPGAWYAPYVAAGVKAGIINGFGNGRFGPEEQITRQDLAAIIFRMVKDKAEVGNTNTFADADEVANYASHAVGALAAANIINGIGNGLFAPQNNATRAEAAKMLAGVYQKFIVE